MHCHSAHKHVESYRNGPVGDTWVQSEIMFQHKKHYIRLSNCKCNSIKKLLNALPQDHRVDTY